MANFLEATGRSHLGGNLSTLVDYLQGQRRLAIEEQRMATQERMSNLQGQVLENQLAEQKRVRREAETPLPIETILDRFEGGREGPMAKYALNLTTSLGFVNKDGTIRREHAEYVNQMLNQPEHVKQISALRVGYWKEQYNNLQTALQDPEKAKEFGIKPGKDSAAQLEKARQMYEIAVAQDDDYRALLIEEEKRKQTENLRQTALIEQQERREETARHNKAMEGLAGERQANKPGPKIVTWKTPDGSLINLKEGEMPPDGSVQQGPESPNFSSPDSFNTWDPDQREYYFEQYRLTGQPPKFYYRDRESLNQFHKAFAKWSKEKGETAADVRAARASTEGLNMSLRNQEKVMGMMGGFVRNIDKQLDRVDEIYGELVNRLGVRAADLPRRELLMRVVGSGNEQVVNAYLIEISNEIGKLSTGSAASIRELSVDAQKQWAKIHDPNLSIKELKKVLDETRNMGKMRIESQQEELEATKKKISNMVTKNPTKGKKVGRFVIEEE